MTGIASRWLAGTCLGPCSCKLADSIMAVVVQANALDKGGAEHKSRRDGAKERWFLKKYRIVWYGVYYLKQVKEKE